MKAAKQPPDPQLVAEASVAVDLVSAWAEDGRELEGTAIVWHCQVCTAEYPRDGSAPKFCAACGDRLGTAPLCKLDPSRQEGDRELVQRVVRGAVAEYLRRHPRARSDGAPYAWHRDDTDPDISPNERDWNIVCLFCKLAINGVGAGKRPNHPAFWERIYKHAWHCAAMYVAGMIESAAPKRDQQALPVNKLHGKDLLVAARQAAEYLGVAEPKRGRYKAGRTSVQMMRRLVATARKLALARMRVERDAERPRAAAISLREVSDLLEHVIVMFGPGSTYATELEVGNG